MAEPLVSVIMPAYKVGPFIGAALRSVAAQTHRNWEVIVVDDHAPDDGTKDIVHDFAKEHPQQRVEFIRHARNQGVSAARNTAIEASRGEHIALLDPDDLWAPWHLENCLASFRKEPAVDVCTGPVVHFRIGPPGTYRKLHPLPDWKVDHFPYSLAVHNFIQPSATVVRRTALMEVGGFETDPALQHIEDYDLWIRLVEAGKRFTFLRTPTSGYRKHAEAASADVQRMKELDQRIRKRHEAFFQAGHSRMLWIALDRVEKLSRGPSLLDRLRGRAADTRFDWIG
jgi:glycosyltransferase involved in cell wall biosynthesis